MDAHGATPAPQGGMAPAPGTPAQPVPLTPQAPPEDDVHIYVDLEEEAPVSEIGQEILGKLNTIDAALPSETHAAPQPPATPQPGAGNGDLYGAPEASENLDSLLPDEALRRVLDDDPSRG